MDLKPVCYAHMCVKCNRNTSGCDRIILRRDGVVVATMHADCAFDEPWTADVTVEGVEFVKCMGCAWPKSCAKKSKCYIVECYKKGNEITPTP